MTFTAGKPTGDVLGDLGLLADLPGHWVGNGFNLIARPARGAAPAFFLELNTTVETLDFAAISGDIPNRGSAQDDINLHGVRYLQQISDPNAGSGIHVEPGVWIRVPPTTDPAVAEDTYVRQGTVPHGTSFLAQSSFAETVNGPPLIDPVDSTPFTGAVPPLNGTSATPVTVDNYLAQYENATLPPGLPSGLIAANVVKNPALVLSSALSGQTIRDTDVLAISTIPAGGLTNIPFLVPNANAAQMDAIFWIERVVTAYGDVLQLQYIQRVILFFDNVNWPHISVATLRKV